MFQKRENIQMEMVLLIVIVAAAAGVAGATDKTREAEAKGAAVVDAVVDLITQSCVFTNDKLMLRRLAKAETDDGEEAHTFRPPGGRGFYGGIWQVKAP